MGLAWSEGGYLGRGQPRGSVGIPAPPPQEVCREVQFLREQPWELGDGASA